jgi:hypothetical protein
VLEQTHRYEAVVRAVLAKGQRNASLRADVPLNLAVLSLFGMINWMHRWYRPELESDAAQIATAFTQIFLDGYSAQAVQQTSAQRRRATRTA